MNSIFCSKTKVLTCFLLPMFLLFHNCSYFGRESFDLQNESLELGDGVKVDMGTTKELIRPMHHLGIRELETKRTSEKSFSIKIKATNVVINNKKVFFGGENLTFEKDSKRNIYSLVDAKRMSKLLVNFNLETFSFGYGDKVFNNENLESLNPTQKTEFLKLLIVLQQFLGENSQQTATYKEWNERKRAAIREMIALDPDSHLGMVASDCYRYNISFGFTRAEAEDKAQQDAEGFLQAYPTCSQVGGIDVTCFLQFMPCVATVTFTCTGAICDERGVVTE